MIFSKQNGGKVEALAELSGLNPNTNEIALEETKLLLKIRTKHEILAKSLAEVEYDVYIENCRLQELNKALQSFTLRLKDVILSC